MSKKRLNDVFTGLTQRLCEDCGWRPADPKTRRCKGSGEDPNAAHVGRQTVGNDLYLTRSLWTVWRYGVNLQESAQQAGVLGKGRSVVGSDGQNEKTLRSTYQAKRGVPDETCVEACVVPIIIKWPMTNKASVYEGDVWSFVWDPRESTLSTQTRLFRNAVPESSSRTKRFCVTK